MTLAPDQKLFASSQQQSSSNNNTNRIRLFDTSTSQLKFTLVDNNQNGHGHYGNGNGNGSYCNNNGALLLAHVMDGNGSAHYLISSASKASRFTIWDVTRGVVAHHVTVPEEWIILDIACSSCCSAAATAMYVYVLVVDVKGKVVVFQYHAAKGKLTRKIKTGTDIDLSNDDSTGKLCLSADGSIIALCTAMSGVRIIDVESGERRRKLKPRSVMGNEPTLLAFGGNDSNFLLCAVKSSDAVYILSCSTTKEVKSDQITLAVDSAPVHAQMMLRTTTKQNEDENSQVIIVISCKSGSISLFETTLSKVKASSNVDLTPDVKVSCESKEEKVDAFNASFLSSSPQQKLLIVRKSASVPSFEIITYREGGRSGSLKKSLVIASKGGSTDVSTKANSKKRTSTEVLGPGEIGVDAVIQDAEQNKKRVKTGDETAELIDESDMLDEGPSIAERIKALTNKPSSDEEQPQGRKVPSTKGVVVIIRQSLASSDSKQLEVALQCHDRNVVENTVAQLTGNEVIDLLGELVHRIATKPTRTESLALWVRTILMKHTNLLMNNTEIANKLAPLRNLLNERVESLPNFLKLEGRLTMLANRK